MPTEKLLQALDAISSFYAKNHYYPSMQELAIALGGIRKSAAHEYVLRLEKEGLITRNNSHIIAISTL